ncbi:MAG TPA: tRNA uracil 4-sulfurtransferase ThiI [Bacilli bacterium]|jgi:thiamine biosynthesis protein ThiI|nr:tRNA uracil 4-sulfurtransferase ThiI [Bacilli bacterium]
MNKLIIIKYGELTTKGDNINYFIKMLKNDIASSLNGIESDITYDKGRMYIKSDESNYDVILDKLNHIFGIHEINVGYELPSNDFEEIKSSLIELIKDKSFKTFKVDTKRSDKNYPIKSMDMSRMLGGVVLQNVPDISVDVHDPDILINVEIRPNSAYIYFNKIKGLGGYPVGVAGKGMLMLSGGIDSPVAFYLAMKRGIRIEAIYFEAPPHTSEAAKNKVIELTRIMSTYSGYVRLHVINFTRIQEEILRNCPRDYLITIMRRMMYRISTVIAYRNNCKCLVNGESVGQVASQTLTSMMAINPVTDLPVIRPVACLDKLDIIEIAKNIGTYETSILPYEDCCTIFVPKHPVINPDKKLCEEYEKLYDFAPLIKEAIENEKVIKVDSKIKEEFSSIL